jgi:hypothetical protein
MKTFRLIFQLVGVLALLGAVGNAQVDMPDPSAIAGTPLPAPELPDGTITVRVVRERMGNNIEGQDVTLTVGGAQRTLKTDAQGRAQFDKLPTGALVQATTVVDGETLTSREFAVPQQGGTRIALIAGIAAAKAAEKTAAEAGAREPARPGVVEIGPESRVIVEYQDDNLTLFYLLEIVNSARTPIDIGGPILIELPTGAAGASMMQGSSPNAGAKGDMVTITGPFPPGKTLAQVGFSLPQATSTMTIRQKWPIAVAQVFVGMEKIGNMQIASPQLTDVRDMNSEGQTFVMGTGPRLNAGDTLVLNLTGLPAHSQTPRNVALATVVVLFVVGAWFAWSPGKAHADQDQKLIARREKLLGEIVALEKKRQSKALSDSDEARLQRATTELERVIAELDRGAAA